MDITIPNATMPRTPRQERDRLLKASIAPLVLAALPLSMVFFGEASVNEEKTRARVVREMVLEEVRPQMESIQKTFNQNPEWKHFFEIKVDSVLERQKINDHVTVEIANEREAFKMIWGTMAGMLGMVSLFGLSLAAGEHRKMKKQEEQAPAPKI
jgi:hypothetical protein